MRVVGYTRVSTKSQAESRLGLESQEQKIRAYCELYDLELVGMEQDAGYTGKNLARPGLHRALKALKGGVAEGMVVAKLDRLTRRTVDAGKLIEGWFSDRRPWALCCVADQVDTRSAAGRLVLNVLFSVAQWEAETIGERTRDALAVKRERGERVGTIPYGYRLVGNGPEIEEDEGEQKVIRMVVGERVRGARQRGIVRTLKKMGVTGRTGKPLHLMQVQRILKAHM